jgi:uncharacterized protein (DUF2236 family)
MPPNEPRFSQATDAAALERHRAAVRARLRERGAVRAGPGSVSWQVNREIVVLAGWGRAILLQLAHPLIAAGVDDHSSFRGSLWTRAQRLSSTVGAMLALTFGSEDEAVAAAAGINRIHDRVSGRLGEPAGAYDAAARYSAHDPELLRWVHATLLDSIPLAYRLLVGPFTRDAHDRYCEEAAVMEPLLDIPGGLLPRTAAALDAYMERMQRERLAVMPRTRTLARAILFPPGWQLLWPAFRPLQLITIGLLPPAIREAYGFGWTGREARALGRWAAALRRLHDAAPRAVREWPAARRSWTPTASVKAGPVRVP